MAFDGKPLPMSTKVKVVGGTYKGDRGELTKLNYEPGVQAFSYTAKLEKAGVRRVFPMNVRKA